MTSLKKIKHKNHGVMKYSETAELDRTFTVATNGNTNQTRPARETTFS